MSNRFTQSPLIAVIRREILRISSSYVLLFTTLIAPVSVFLLVQWMFSAGVIRDLPISIVDMDQSSLSRKITHMVDATPVASVKYKSRSLEEAQSLMNRGKAEAILVIPANMYKDILSGKAPNMALYINNTNLVKGGTLKSGLYKTLATVSAGIKVQTYQKKGATEYMAMEKALPIKTDVHILFNPFGSYAYFLALGLLPMMLTVFAFLGSVYALGIELKDGTAGELMQTAHNDVITAITGKFFPYTLLYLINAMVMNLILFKGQDTPLHGNLLVILISELMLIVAYQAIAILFLNITANLRLSLSLGSAYTMMALTFSGLTFPSMAMPMVAKVFSYIFPYTPWLKIFLSQTLRGEPVAETFWPMALLLLYFLTGVASFPGIKQKLINPLKWGKD